LICRTNIHKKSGFAKCDKVKNKFLREMADFAVVDSYISIDLPALNKTLKKTLKKTIMIFFRFIFRIKRFIKRYFNG
jgi:hypothetical protein